MMAISSFMREIFSVVCFTYRECPYGDASDKGLRGIIGGKSGLVRRKRGFSVFIARVAFGVAQFRFASVRAVRSNHW